LSLVGWSRALYNAGIEKLGVIHRGFSTYEKTKYRIFQMANCYNELQNKFPDLPLIIDHRIYW
jgi:chorismate mutase